jgi:peptidyl-tRNA hydrolase, PTH1 family
VIGSETVLLAKPETFMNLSGNSVRELVAEYEMVPESDLLVLQDELDFPWGTVRVHRNRSAAGHHGIESLIGTLGTQDFLRIRMGVGPEKKVEDGISYLLSPFRKAQGPVIDAMLESAAEAVAVILKEGPAAAMNRFNRKEPDAEN